MIHYLKFSATLNKNNPLVMSMLFVVFIPAARSSLRTTGPGAGGKLSQDTSEREEKNIFLQLIKNISGLNTRYLCYVN